MKILFFLLVFCFFLSADYKQQIALLEQVSCPQRATMTVADLYSRLSPSEKAFLAGEFKKQLLKMLPADILQNSQDYLTGSENQAYAAYLKLAVEFLNASSTSQMVAVIDKMDLTKPVILDPALFRIYHDQVSVPSVSDDVNGTPAYIKDGVSVIKEYSFGDVSGVSFPKTEFVPSHQGSAGTIGKISEVIDFSRNCIGNSIRIAAVLNQLSNVGSSGVYAPVNFSLDGKEFILKSPEDLIKSFASSEKYEIVGFQARMGVDFFGYCLSSGGNLVNLEIPTVMTTQIKDLYIPSNHSEYLIGIYLKNSENPEALVKWYMGIPTDNALHQGTIWKPAVMAHSPWSGFKITHSYSKKESLEKMTEIAMGMMKAFNKVQLAAAYKMNGYGVLAVCNDSAAIMETALNKTPDFVAWPNLRSLHFDGLYHKVLSKYSSGCEMSGNHLNVPSDVYPDIYYNNSININYRRRLVLNLPFRSKNSVNGNSFVQAVQKLSEMSGSSFGKDLNLIITD